MLGDKRGLSTIVVTLIIILISLVAIGIVWVVVRTVINRGSGTIDISAECIITDVTPVAMNCSSVGSSRICDTTLERTGIGTSKIDGVKIVFKNTTAGTSSGLISLSGNIEPLVTKLDSGRNTTISSVDRVEVNVFFKDANGNDQICPQTNVYAF